jgi:pSer/pThr/pTyr-binding forkhead associated (FHA) protein
MVIIGETASIRDLESSNGVYVNGKRVATIALLYSEDEIQLGATKFVMVPFAMLTSLERENGLAKKEKPAGSTKITQPLMELARPKHIELLTNRKTSQ